MELLVLVEILYLVFVLGFCLRVIYDTDDSVKSLAYLMLIIFLPIFGMLFYLAFGMNFRKRDLFKTKSAREELRLAKQWDEWSEHKATDAFTEKQELDACAPLIKYLIQDGYNPLSTANDVELLINGESKFPALISAMESAKKHIHMAYYIIENDALGNEILDLLVRKAKEGVEVRLLFDGLGSKNIRGAYAQKLRDAGGEAVAFNPIKVYFLASKINYRNHRKIAVIDGDTGFIGGVNICDKYVNSGSPDQLYWRDTHLKIQGLSVQHLQQIFLFDWNFAARQQLQLADLYFPDTIHVKGRKAVQVVAGGPDCSRAVIMLSMLKTIHLAKRYIYITSPYFIPNTAIVSALKLAALSGVDVRLLLPDVADSFTVNAAARSYYKQLLAAGVSVYLYEKGFVHAKTMVLDDHLAVVGTSNMDIRSFDINFEVNAHVYDKEIAVQLRDAFIEDIAGSRKLDYDAWKNRPWTKVLPERLARLFSPLL